jgi:hypothetical protein
MLVPNQTRYSSAEQTLVIGLLFLNESSPSVVLAIGPEVCTQASDICSELLCPSFGETGETCCKLLEDSSML